MAPLCRATSWPLLNTAMVGMLEMLNRLATPCIVSVLAIRASQNETAFIRLNMVHRVEL
jgi:hypothetical protein